MGRGQSRLHRRNEHLWRHPRADRAAQARIPRRGDHGPADRGRRRLGRIRRSGLRRQPHRHHRPGLLPQGSQQHLRRRRAAGGVARQGDGSRPNQAPRHRRRFHRGLQRRLIVLLVDGRRPVEGGHAAAGRGPGAAAADADHFGGQRADAADGFAGRAESVQQRLFRLHPVPASATIC